VEGVASKVGGVGRMFYFGVVDVESWDLLLELLEVLRGPGTGRIFVKRRDEAARGGGRGIVEESETIEVGEEKGCIGWLIWGGEGYEEPLEFVGTRRGVWWDGTVGLEGDGKLEVEVYPELPNPTPSRPSFLAFSIQHSRSFSKEAFPVVLLRDADGFEERRKDEESKVFGDEEEGGRASGGSDEGEVVLGVVKEFVALEVVVDDPLKYLGREGFDHLG